MMKKLFLVPLFCLIIPSLLFADSDGQTSADDQSSSNTKSSSATLTIKGYKKSTEPTEGTLKVYIYDTRSSTSSTTSVSDSLDVTDYVKKTTNNYISDYKDIFSIKIETNLKNPVKISIRFSPFVSQSEKQDIIPTSYSLTYSGASFQGTYEEENGSGGGWWGNTTTTTYSIKHTPSTEDGKSTYSAEASIDDSGNVAFAYVNIVQKITSQKMKSNGFGNKNWSNYTNSSSSTTLEHIDSNTIKSLINVKMKLVPTEAQRTAHSTTNGITPNIQYVAPVTITVSIE